MPRARTRPAPPPAVPIGQLVAFTAGRLGASRRDDLSRVTEDVYGPGDFGRVAFVHPNPRIAAEWFYVEVGGKSDPADRLFVPVTERSVLVVTGDVLESLRWLAEDEDAGLEEDARPPVGCGYSPPGTWRGVEGERDAAHEYRLHGAGRL